MNTQLNVMVIDDHPLQTTILSQILDRYCAQVIPFNCVDAAIQSVQEQHFDVIFCDIQMPGKDGSDMMEMLDKVQYQGQVVLVSAMELTIISA
ncbi:response regulator, partial [Vibrio parahaemolyticus]|nr:response regulator [Vibrio parahaemolyticus]